MGNITIVIGAQWGDEGKGKWVDILAKDADIIARFQGGNNAGHTLYVNGQKIVLHQIPSGFFQGGKTCALSAGVVVNPIELAEEIEQVKAFNEVNPNNLWISARAHVITPWHVFLDTQREERGSLVIGTTKRGIGPTYAEKIARSGLRLGHYIDKETRLQWLEQMKRDHQEFKAFWLKDPERWDDFHRYAEKIKPFVTDAEAKLRQVIYQGKKVLLEGAQGTLLDIDHGTYPFVTSSSTTAGGAVQSIGFNPKAVEQIIGISKAYTTRVGTGPLPTELKDEPGRHLADKGVEFGATTGRPRRCGWLDGFALNYAQKINGLTSLVLNKMDVLAGLEEIKLATGYEHPTLGQLIDYPWCPKVMAECQPIYQTFAGWDEDISECKTFADLPKAAQKFVLAVQDAVKTPVKMIGTGVNRHNGIFL